MYFKPSELSSQDNYRLLAGGVVPRPIAWVSSISTGGTVNLAPYSFFTVASCDPPVLAFTQVNPRNRPEKDTLKNLQATGECVVNIVSADLVEAMNATCADYPHEISEFLAVGISQTPSVAVSPPGVSESKVRYECRLRDVVRVSDQPAGGTLMLLDVIGIHVSDPIYSEGLIDQGLLDAVGKMGGDYYAHTREKFELERPNL